MYCDIWFLVIAYHPIVETRIVLNRIVSEVPKDFCTYCFIKKSDSAAIDITAKGGI